MNRKIAEIVLKTWIECPVHFGNGCCPKDEDEYCKEFCWSQSEVEEAVRLMLDDNKLARWIPVDERLPEEKINPITQDSYVYPVTVAFGDLVDIRYYSFCRGHWYNHGQEELDRLVVAWQERPEPYRPE